MSCVKGCVDLAWRQWEPTQSSSSVKHGGTLIIPVLGRQDREIPKFEVLLGYTGTLSRMRVFNNGLPKGSNLKIGKTEKLMGVLKKKMYIGWLG